MSANDITGIIGAVGMVIFLLLMAVGLFSEDIVKIIREIKRK